MKPQVHFLLLLVSFSLTGVAQSFTANKVTSTAPTAAYDVATKYGNFFYVVGDGPHGKTLYESTVWNPKKWEAHKGFNNAARVNMSSNGSPMVITSDGRAFLYNQGKWMHIVSDAKEVTENADKKIVRLNKNQAQGRNFKMEWKDWQTWKPMNFAGTDIAMDYKTKIFYFTNGEGQLYRLASGKSTLQSVPNASWVKAQDNGAVWALGKPDGDGHQIFKMISGQWKRQTAAAIAIQEDANGKVWLIDARNRLWHGYPGTGADLLTSKAGATTAGGGSGGAGTGTGTGSSSGGGSSGGGTGGTTQEGNGGNPGTKASVDLFAAVVSGDEAKVQAAIDAKVDLNKKNENGETALILAIKSRRFGVASQLIAAGADVNSVSTNGQTALLMAIDQNSAELVDEILAKGADPSKGLALSKAIQKNNLDIVSTLLAKGASPQTGMLSAAETNNKDIFAALIAKGGRVTDNNVLKVILQKNNREIIEMALENGANPDEVLKHGVKTKNKNLIVSSLEQNAKADNAVAFAIESSDGNLLTMLLEDFGGNGDEALKLSCNSGNTDLVDRCLRAGANADYVIAEEAKKGNLAVVEVLLDNNANANLGMLPAIEAKQVKMALLLIDAGVDVNKKEFLDGAVKVQSLEMVQALVDEGADPKHGLETAVSQNYGDIALFLLDQGPDASNPTLIAYAAKHGNVEMVGALLDNNAKADNGMENATLGNKTAVVRLLLDEGADATPAQFLERAATKGNLQMAQDLVGSGANPENGAKASVEAGKIEVVKFLAEEGADFSKQTYLVNAVRKGFYRVVEFVIGEGADVSYKEASGRNLMHLAAIGGSANIINLLAENGVEVDAVDKKGDTPLLLAVNEHKNGIELAKALITQGANVNAENAKGKSVLKEAKGNKLKKFLKEQGASK